jgi:hypothetical protein
MEIIRENAGIDIAKNSFVATLTVLLTGQIVKHLGTKKFKNNKKGFDEFYNWCKELQNRIGFTKQKTCICRI